MDIDPTLHRVFVVCGRGVEAEVLQEAFQPFGNLQSVKVIKEKGVGYISFDKASSAALAIENLNGIVLNDGRGPRLKVMVAEPPSARGATPTRCSADPELSSDPDNMPPRSRLFIVVPKQADSQQIQDHLRQYPDLEYCKTDLISTKGCVFTKFFKSSSALKAMEDILSTSMVAGYKVKCMLAEPKSKRRADGSPQEAAFGHMPQAAKHEFAVGNFPPETALQLKLASAGGMNLSDFTATLGSLAGLAGTLAGGFQLPGVNTLADVSSLGTQLGMGFSMSNLQSGSPVSLNNNNSPEAGRQRLFVVVHKGAADDAITRLFRRFPGMEYCDLKKDRASGKSKGFCYVNYSTPEAAKAAIDQLNGSEFPLHSGHHIKVMYAEPMHVRSTQVSSDGPQILSPSVSASALHSPLSRNMSPDIINMQDSLSGMSMHRAASQNGNLDQDLAARMVSPPSSGALNNLAHSSPLPMPRELFGAH